VSKSGRLFLIPVPISENAVLLSIPQGNFPLVHALQYFIVENAKSARAHLKSMGYPGIGKANITELNEHTSEKELSAIMAPLLEGHDLGLMSDAGCPGVADPGAAIVNLAHKKNVEVIPLVGPGSVLLAVMSSGFNGQNFAFNGYLPVDKTALNKKILELEKKARHENQSQFFIETPYRNISLFENLLKTLNPGAQLYIGADLAGPSQFVKTKSVLQWKTGPPPTLHKVPALFGIFK
jgi:16S rRNA (cytidine1402-2'-O)-methyltransferase